MPRCRARHPLEFRHGHGQDAARQGGGGADEWDAVIRVHLYGSYHVSRAAAHHFKEQNGGAFVHMTSTSGLIGNLGQANYNAAKMGIAALSKSIALDMQKFNEPAAPGALGSPPGRWTPQSLAEHGIPALKAAFVPMERSADVFSWDPV